MYVLFGGGLNKALNNPETQEAIRNANYSAESVFWMVLVIIFGLWLVYTVYLKN